VLEAAGPDHRGEQRDGEHHEGAGKHVRKIEHAVIVAPEPLRFLSAGENVPKTFITAV
jgi:hypothetical protein